MMSTGLTFGMISVLYGFSHNIVTQEQYSFCLTEKGCPINESAIKIRLMKADDFDAVVKIDERILKTSRPLVAV